MGTSVRNTRRLDIDGRMVGPSHMILQVSPIRVPTGHNPKKEKKKEPEVRSIHWSPYDRVRVVNADP